MIISGTTLNGTAVNDGLVTNGLKLYLDSRNPNSWTGSGQTWYDISGNNKHATFYTNPNGTNNTATTEATATAGTNLTYNQFNDVRFKGDTTSNVYQYAAGSNLGTNITQWTINTWFWIYAFPGSTTILPTIFTGEYTGAGGQTSTVNFCLTFYNGASASDNLLRGAFFDGAWRVTPGATVNINTWYNAVVTYDGATLKLYLNNALSQSLSVASTAMTSTLNYRVARRWDGYDSFDGYVPIAMVYNRALSATEIGQNFNYHRGRYGV
jgi:hypothetical protein